MNDNKVPRSCAITWRTLRGSGAGGGRAHAGLAAGTCPGMTKSRAIRAHLMRPGSPALSIGLGVAVDYSG